MNATTPAKKQRLTRDRAERFVEHLLELKRHDRGALAALRHSLAFEPGDDPRSFPHVERHVGRGLHALDARRLAMYAVAGLFALQPERRSQPLAAALGQLLREKGRPSLELRFRALLEADATGLMPHLRQAVSLLAADDKGFDPVELLLDLGVLLNDRAPPDWRDDVRRRWARQFYTALQADGSDDDEPKAAAPVAAGGQP